MRCFGGLSQTRKQAPPPNPQQLHLAHYELGAFFLSFPFLKKRIDDSSFRTARLSAVHMFSDKLTDVHALLNFMQSVF